MPLRIGFLLLLVAAPVAAQSAPFEISREGWDAERLGNHRAVVRVEQAGFAARAVLEWRRPDRRPETKAVLVVDARSGAVITNVRRGRIDQVSGEIDFEPTAGPGEYYLYYLPFKSGGRSNYPNVTYLPVESTADAGWLARLEAAASVPQARTVRFEAVDSLNAFYPMEVVAAPEETARLLAAHPDAGFLVFPEDRLHPIRMRDQLPLRWVARGPLPALTEEARRGEFVAFQFGVYARRALTNLTVRFGDLASPAGETISAAQFASINTGGTGWDGQPFTKRVDVTAGQVQPLWCGLDVPLDAKPGRYTGYAVITADGLPPDTVTVGFLVRPDSVLDGGASEPWKQTRLKWLNSTLAQRNDVIAPYTPLTVTGTTIGLLGRKLRLAPNGLPAGIETYFTEAMTGFSTTPKPVLARPVEFVVEPAVGRAVPVRADGVHFTDRSAGTVRWTAASVAPDWRLDVQGALEFDGFASYTVKLTATRRLDLRDVRMTLPFARESARYLMGLGQKGGRRPASLEWKWDVATKNQDGAWIGDVNAGLLYTLRAENYVRPLNTNFYLQKPLNLPASWGNGGRGRITITEVGNLVRVTNSSGARVMNPGDSLFFNFTLLITPFHPIDTDFQWSHRFYHAYAPIDSIRSRGANVVNIHHATAINPYINYPFLAHDAMKAYINQAHGQGLSVKIYNTVRELSNRAYEVFALRSLGHEVYSPGKGGGYAWLQEHLVDDYIAGWFVPELKDAAIINSGMSRWHNYYIEGINWLVKNVGIDGLYLDDVAFDRTTMKRLKRVLAQDGHPAIIDLHSANQYNKNDGFNNSAVLYLEHFPYLNRLWFGEYFDYEKNDPDFFLTEVSGIPFGLMGEMLEGGGNPWRGMVYGMTNRMPWTENADPGPLWKLWRDFGIQGSTMIGYWVRGRPMTTGRDDVLATVYRQKGRTLVALASWAPDTVQVRLHISWKALGIDSAAATISAPDVRGLQAARRFKPGESISVAPGKGWLLVLQ